MGKLDKSEEPKGSPQLTDNWIVVAWDYREVQEHLTNREAVTLYNTTTKHFRVWNNQTGRYDDRGIAVGTKPADSADMEQNAQKGQPNSKSKEGV